jgi:hypothetical protein
MKTKFGSMVVVLIAFVWRAGAQIIDFEKMPDGSLPTEGMVISNQFQQLYGVSFAFTNGAYPCIAVKDGTNTIAFYGPPSSSKKNHPAANQNVGQFFLTDDGRARGNGSPPPPLVITYATPVSAASGVILDVDLQESWKLEARNAQTQVLATVILDNTAATPNRGDGRACPWAFTNEGITSIVISYTGSDGGPGLAFDNFSPALPVNPASLSDMTMNAQGLSLNINANFGQALRIEYADVFPSTNWQVLTNVFLTNTPTQQIMDRSWTNSPRRFYRAVGIN